MHPHIQPWQQHWFVLRASRCEIAWRKERDSVLRVQIRLVKQRALFITVFLAILVLTAVSTALLAYMHVGRSFLAMALSPIIIFFVIVIIYKAMAPMEELIFNREKRTCIATATSLCGVRRSTYTGVRRAESVAFPLPHAPSTHIYGLPMHPPPSHAQAQANGALRLVIVHEHGQAISINMWPIGDAQRLRRAVIALNVFLHAPVKEPSHEDEAKVEANALEAGEGDNRAKKHVSFVTDVEQGPVNQQQDAPRPVSEEETPTVWCV